MNTNDTNLPTDAHPLVRFVRAGRGYGVTLCPVLNFAGAPKSRVLHVADDRPGFPKVLCGRNVEPDTFYTDVDARAVRIKNRTVCATCSRAIGLIPPPRPASESEGES